jgi:hypothetical protein
MENYIKHLSLVLAISIFLIGSCKKDKTATVQAVDFRDSLVGRYTCITINASGSPGGSSADTVKDTITVIKSSDSSILIGGAAFAFSDNSQGYIPPGLQFTGSVTNSVSCLSGASFPTNGSSIYWLNECYQASTSSSSVTTGNRIY